MPENKWYTRKKPKRLKDFNLACPTGRFSVPVEAGRLCDLKILTSDLLPLTY
jgi:hypothetical protein